MSIPQTGQAANSADERPTRAYIEEYLNTHKTQIAEWAKHFGTTPEKERAAFLAEAMKEATTGFARAGYRPGSPDDNPYRRAQWAWGCEERNRERRMENEFSRSGAAFKKRLVTWWLVVVAGEVGLGCLVALALSAAPLGMILDNIENWKYHTPALALVILQLTFGVYVADRHIRIKYKADKEGFASAEVWNLDQHRFLAHLKYWAVTCSFFIVLYAILRVGLSYDNPKRLWIICGGDMVIWGATHQLCFRSTGPRLRLYVPDIELIGLSLAAAFCLPPIVVILAISTTGLNLWGAGLDEVWKSVSGSTLAIYLVAKLIAAALTIGMIIDLWRRFGAIQNVAPVMEITRRLWDPFYDLHWWNHNPRAGSSSPSQATPRGVNEEI